MELTKAIVDCMQTLRRRLRDELDINIRLSQSDAINAMLAQHKDAITLATKAADVQIGFLDRFGGSLLLTGDVASVEAGLREVLRYFGDVLHYALTDCTRS